MQPSQEKDIALRLTDNLKVKTTHIYAKASTLSGEPAELMSQTFSRPSSN